MAVVLFGRETDGLRLALTIDIYPVHRGYLHQNVGRLAADVEEPGNARVARLERLLEALDCSRAFFNSVCAESHS